jgi:hypothetical protein
VGGHHACWGLGDFIFSRDYDFFSDASKSRHSGFHEYTETEKMLFNLFDGQKAKRIIPT